MSKHMVPVKAFFISGVGQHKDKLQAFDQALLAAGPLVHNLVSVSSILPAGCEIISKEEGLALLTPGEITFCVMARQDTNKPGEWASSAVGVLNERGTQEVGYLSEFHGTTEGNEKTAEEAKRLAEEMYLTKMGKSKESLDLDFHKATTASIQHPGDEGWVCAVAFCIFILPD